MNPTLHLVVDPLCGWCYGATPLFQSSMDIEGLDIQVHGGGLLIDDRKKNITPDWKDFASAHDEKIEALSGQPFGKAYKNGLLNDTTAILDSEPPIKAMMAAEKLSKSGLAMLIALQKAMYFEGREVAKLETLSQIASEQGLSEEAFKKAYRSIQKADFDQHIATSRHVLGDIQGNGFPSAGLALNETKMLPLNMAHYYGNPDGWRSYLLSALKKD